MDGRRVRDVARVALFGWDGHDLAAELKDGPGAGRGNCGAAEPLAAPGVALAELGQVRGDADREAPILVFPDVVEMEDAGLLEDDPARAGRGVEHGIILERGQLLDLAGRAVVGEEVELAVPVRPEIDFGADPHRPDVVRPAGRLGDFFDGLVGRVEDPDPRKRAASVILPLEEGVAEGVVGDGFPVRGIDGAIGVRDRELDRKAALHGDRVKPQIGAHGRIPGRNEDDGFSVGREALDEVRGRVPGQPLGDAPAGRDDENVRVPVVLAAEGDEGAVRREGRIGFDADVRRQAPDVLSAEVRGPEVIGIDEGHLTGAHGRLGQELRVLRVDGQSPAETREDDDRTQDDGKRFFHFFLRGVIKYHTFFPCQRFMAVTIT